MRLDEFLDMCEPNTLVEIRNLNGTGGAKYLAWEEWNWTAGEALEELASACYRVCGIEVRDGMLRIEADELPWNFGSYWDGEWYGEPCDEYEVEITYKVDVVEPSAKAAKLAALERIRMNDADGVFTGIRREDGAIA